MNILKNRNKGIGLIEVLVTTVVVAIGLLALASLQGTFYSSSGDSKTRSEALVIAEKEMERVRNMILSGDYTTLPTPTTPVTGSNESFTVAQGIVAATSPTRKEVTITVTWGGAATDETISLTSEVVFSDPASSVSLAAYGEIGAGSFGRAPNPNQNSSETVSDTDIISTVDGVDTDITDVYLVEDAAGNAIYVKDSDGSNPGTEGTQVFLISNLNKFDVDYTAEVSNDLDLDNDIYLYTRRLSLDNVTGNEVIELFTDNGDRTATRQHRYFGGVINSIKGTIRTVFNLDDIKIDFNKEDMLCVFNPGVLQTERNYACYTGGNCNVSPNGTGTDNHPSLENVNLCSNPATADISVLAGGFSGNVGMLNVDDQGGGKESVCFAGDISGTSTNFSTARKYKTNNTNSSPTEEGINESYNCQDFLIVGRQANLAQLAAECAAQVGTLNLPPKEIERTIAIDATNIAVIGANNTYCTASSSSDYIVNGTISGAGTTRVVTVADGTCTSTTSTYSCSLSTIGTTIEIHVSSSDLSGNTVTDFCTSVLTSVSPTINSGCSITLTIPPTYIATGTITGLNNTNGLSISVTGGLDSGTCIATQTNYRCSITTNEPSILIEATDGTGPNATNDSCPYSGLSSAATDLPRDSETACELTL